MLVDYVLNTLPDTLRTAKCAQQRIELISDTQLTPEWKPYKLKGTKPEAFPAGEACVDFFMGEKPGVIEISDVVLTQ